MAFFAAELGALLFGSRRHLAAHVAAEQIADPFAFTQSVDHRVESALQLAEFSAVEYHHVAVEVALFNVFERRAHHAHRRRGQPRHDPRQDEADEERDDRQNPYRSGELRRREILQRDCEHGEQGNSDDG